MTKLDLAVIIAAFGSGLVGGVFFGFSTFVMGALHALVPSAGIAAMQSINVVVKNVWFMGALFGIVPLCIWLGVTSYAGAGTPATLRVLAAVLHLVGCIGVTAVYHVPRNEALMQVDPHSAQGAALWASYVPGWTFWNHVRCVCCCAACLMFMLSLLQRD